MTPHELESARNALNLTAAALGRALELEGRDTGQSVRRWETGAKPIPGPVVVAVRLMLENQQLAHRIQQLEKAERRRQTIDQRNRATAQATFAALEAEGVLGVEPEPAPPAGLVDLMQIPTGPGAHIPRTRRRSPR